MTMTPLEAVRRATEILSQRSVQEGHYDAHEVAVVLTVVEAGLGALAKALAGNAPPASPPSRPPKPGSWADRTGHKVGDVIDGKWVIMDDDGCCMPAIVVEQRGGARVVATYLGFTSPRPMKYTDIPEFNHSKIRIQDGPGEDIDGPADGRARLVVYAAEPGSPGRVTTFTRDEVERLIDALRVFL